MPSGPQLPPVLTPEPARCTACAAHAAIAPHILWPCIPIASYGDVRRAEAITIGLNPSDNLFYRRTSRTARPRPERLPMLIDFAVPERAGLRHPDVQAIEAEQHRIFSRPLHPWFRRLAPLLTAAAPHWSYEAGTVAHLDLAACATDQWATLSEEARHCLITTCRPHFLAAIGRAAPAVWLLLNGRTVRERLPATDWAVTRQGQFSGSALHWAIGTVTVGPRQHPYLAWNLSAQRLPTASATALGRLLTEHGYR